MGVYGIRLFVTLALFSSMAGLPLLGQQSPVMSFDAAPYAISTEQGSGMIWDDPREIHSVTVEFAENIPADLKIRLEYWGSHWPQQRLPKDHEPGGGDTGWMELGNWSIGGWRVADAEQTISSNSVRFAFRPINSHEYPELKGY